MARRTKTAKAAPAAETSKDGITIHEIPLATPDFSKPTGPTLLDVIEEKRPRHTDGTPIGVDDGLDLEIPPVIIAFSFAVPLTMMLFAFDVLVHRQYRQELEYWLIFLRCSKAFPAIWTIHYFFHDRRAWLSVRLFLLSMGIAAGCWLVQAVNTKGYYAVMKRTPPLATLCIWAVIELDITFAILNCMIVGGYTWYNGYKIL